MKTEIKKLAALVELALQTNALIPITQTEILAALSNIESGLEKRLFFDTNLSEIKNDLQQASLVLSGLLYSLDNHLMNNFFGTQKVVIAKATALQRKLGDMLKWYCYDNNNRFSLLPLKNLSKVVLEVESRLENAIGTTSLYAIIKDEISEVKKTKLLPCHRWMWWSRFLSAILNMPAISLTLFEELLTSLNFNTPAFISWLSLRLQEELETKKSPVEKVELVSAELSKHLLLTVPFNAYMPAEKSVKQVMIAILQNHSFCFRMVAYPEVAFKQQQLSKLSTALSVPQLALFVRLLVDTNIISQQSQSSLLTHIAMIMHTAKAPQISPESLRINYYTPNTAAKNIVKEYLINMVNRLKYY